MCRTSTCLISFILLLGLTVGITHADIKSDLISHWKLDDGSGASSFNDETSNNNDGSCTACPDWSVGGKDGGTYNFNGSDDFISVGTSSELALADFTVSAWFRWEAEHSTDIYSSIISRIYLSQQHKFDNYHDILNYQNFVR